MQRGRKRKKMCNSGRSEQPHQWQGIGKEARRVCSRGAGEDGCTESVTLTTGRGTEGSVCSLLQPPLQPPHPQSVQALLTYDQ